MDKFDYFLASYRFPTSIPDTSCTFLNRQ